MISALVCLTLLLAVSFIVLYMVAELDVVPSPGWGGRYPLYGRLLVLLLLPALLLVLLYCDRAEIPRAARDVLMVVFTGRDR